MSLSKTSAALLLFLSLLVGMWWLSLFQYSMKWDIMDITLPWNHFICESIKAGQLPLWNPAIKNGFPIMGLPDTWYPITWIISLLFGMDVWSIQLDYMLHLWIGGFGMYTYVKCRKIDANFGLALGVCYMFSGFMIGNAQHLGWVIGAAWLPWVIFYFEKLLSNRSKTDVLSLSVVTSLFFYGSYPPITIITFYLLMAKLIWAAIKNQEIRNVKTIIVFGLSFLLFAMISSVGLLGLLELSPQLDRGDSLPLTNNGWGVLTGFLPLESISSFLIPYAGTAVEGSWGSDISLINCYCGFLILLIVLGGVWIRDKPTIKYLVLGVGFLMVAMSEVFPFRSWLYYLPMFDKFRFPSLFRLFTIFYLLLASGYAYESLKKTPGSKKVFKSILGIAIVALIGLFVYSLLSTELNVVNALLKDGLRTFHRTAGFFDKAIVDLLVHVVLVGLLLLGFFFDKLRYSHIPLFIILEVVIISQFNISETVIHFGDPSVGNVEIKHYQGQEFNVDLTKPMNTFDDGYWRSNLTRFRFNQASITKTPSASGNSPFSLHKHKEAKQNQDLVLNNYPLLFFSEIEGQKVLESSIDSFSSEHIGIVHVDHNEIVIQTDYDREANLVFLQNKYPGWNAKVDGQAVEISTVNTTFMSISLLAGVHDVVIYFAPKQMILAFWLSLGSFVLTLIVLILLYFKEEHS